MTTTSHRKLTFRDTLEAARQQGEIDEIVEKTMAMSDEEIERELAAEGIDVAELDAHLAERAEELFARFAPPRSRARGRVAVGFGAGVLTGASALAALAQTGVVSVGGAVATLATPSTTGAPAPDLRKQAFELCGRGRWQECLARFDEAKTLDAEGDKDPEVQAARKRAKAMLAPR
jgi:hypothetical protein